MIEIDLWRIDEEIRSVDAELARLDARRGRLLARRSELRVLLDQARAWAERQERERQREREREEEGARAKVAVPAAPDPVPAPAGARRDLSRHAVQNLLLLLGGLLLGIAAIVFTVVSWGHLSIRAAILAAVTAGALAAPWPLVRRGLRSTAETVAFIGLVLVPLTYMAVSNAVAGGSTAPDEVDLPGTGGASGFWAAAAATAALAAAWAGYARYAPLRLPAPAALALAQAPLPLAAVAAGPTPAGAAAALILTAALDLLVRHRAAAPPVRAVAAATGIAAGAGGIATALAASLLAGTPGAALRASAVLVLAVAVAAAGAWATGDRTLRTLAAAVAGTCAIVAVAAPLAASFPDPRWAVAAYAGAACLLLACAARPPERLREGLAAAGLGALAVAVAWVAAGLAIALVAPFGWFASPDAFWRHDGAGPPAYANPHAFWSWNGSPATPLVLAAAAAASAAVPARATRTLGLVLAVAAAAALPAAVSVAHEAWIALPLAVAVALLALAARARTVPAAPILSGAAAYTAVLALGWSVMDAATALITAAVPAAAFLAFARPARTAVAQAVSAAGAVLAAGTLAVLAWAAYGWPPLALPFALLGIRTLALLVALPPGEPPPALARAVAGSRRTGRTILLGVMFALARAGLKGTALRARRPVQAAALDAASAAVSLTAIGYAAFSGPEALALLLALTALPAAATAWSRKRAGRPAAPSLGESYLLAALAPLPLGDALFPALFGPYGWLADAWAGAPPGARGALAPGTAWTDQPMLLPVLGLAALAAVGAAAVHKGRPGALGVAQVAVPVAVAPVPLAADLPYWAALAFLVAVTTGLALRAAAHRSAAGGAALWTATLAVSWSLADPAATLAVLAVLALAAVLCALRGGDSPVASAASGAAALAVGAEGAAVALAGDLPARYAAFAVVAVAVLAVRAGALLAGRRPWIAHALDAAGLVLWCAALAMTGGHADQLSLVCAIGGLTAAMAGVRAREQARPVVLAFAGTAAGIALLPHLPGLAAALAAPFGWTAGTWSAALPVPAEHPVAPAAAATAVLAALTAVAAARLLGGRAAHRAAVIAVPAASVLLPFAAGLPYAAGLALACGILAALAVRAALARGADLAAAGTALPAAAYAVAWALPSTVATLAVAAGIAALATGCAPAARGEPARSGAAAAAVLAFAGLAVAGALAAGLRAELAGLTALAVAALAAYGARETGRWRRAPGLATEAAAYAAAAAGTALTFASVPYASAGLACAGLLALATALRPDRRHAGWAAAMLLLLALWLRLGAAGVTAPEAYTAPVTVLGLLGGRWARRRDGALSSWAAYGAALALTLVPALAAAWYGGGPARPLLLAPAALAVTLAGARYRLQAPLLLGGAVLVLNAAHELGPALADLVGDGPRWLPIAVTGTALLFAGATYEHRLRDLRRVRRSIAAMK
ncbi:SCO7613 C-terminal domain-containing membrane protein [Actinomadura sp. 21ATH]|uniref:SCO7613 C-terminal domain-containing membrane protein n=1 Tax=Actinomadura sp. 21ATH TaxID=1735444 RepID=UPI0035BFBD1D